MFCYICKVSWTVYFQLKEKEDSDLNCAFYSFNHGNGKTDKRMSHNKQKRKSQSKEDIKRKCHNKPDSRSHIIMQTAAMKSHKKEDSRKEVK